MNEHIDYRIVESIILYAKDFANYFYDTVEAVYCDHD